MSVRDVVPQRREDPDPEVVAAMDLLGQRWVLRIVWELEPGSLGFLELRRRMGNCSSSVLATRLADDALREKYIDAATQRVARYDWSVVASQIMRVYETVAGAGVKVQVES